MSKANGVPIANLSRTKETRAHDEEVGAELRLGDFEGVDCLNLSETKEVITALFAHRLDTGQYPVPDNEVVTKTRTFLDMFARFKSRESIHAVERLLAEQTNLDKFERAQLGSLCCEEAEEAKMLIPSLANKKTDDELQEIVEEVGKLRNFN